MTHQDFEYVKRIFRYLQGTKDFGLLYCSGEDHVESYSDASHRDCPNSTRSTTGFIIKVFGDLVHWNSKRQSSVSSSTCESEYKALNKTARELNYLNGALFRLIGRNFSPNVMKSDSESAMMCTAKPGASGLRHLTRSKDHYILECVRDKRITLEKVESSDNVSDILTKPLPREQFQKLRSFMVTPSPNN